MTQIYYNLKRMKQHRDVRGTAPVSAKDRKSTSEFSKTRKRLKKKLSNVRYNRY